MRIVELSLAERDNYLDQIEQQIHSKRGLLIAKKKALEQNAKKNQFLNGISHDYQNYYNYIVKQKQDQLRSMELLKQYIGDINSSGNYTVKDLNKSKKEQKVILNEMGKIKSELDDIIQQP
jgi:iron uptake system EfeUOB component EfeO/EfeM